MILAVVEVSWFAEKYNAKMYSGNWVFFFRLSSFEVVVVVAAIFLPW